MEQGFPSDSLQLVDWELSRGPTSMLHAGFFLDLCRRRLDFHLLNGEGATVEIGSARMTPKN
jgi:hypothetical protein